MLPVSDRNEPRQKRSEMLRHADRPDARAAAAVRDAKRFVQIQMANVRADVARPAKADLRVHVRAIHVNLAAVRMNDLANLADGRFENAVRGRIGHHQRGQIVFVRVGLRAQIGEIDVAVFQAGDGTTLNPAMTALAGLVPWAEVGMRQTLRCASPRDA